MNDEIKINWPWVVLISLAIIFWTSVWYNGFFISLMWLIVVAAVIGIWLRITGRA